MARGCSCGAVPGGWTSTRRRSRVTSTSASARNPRSPRWFRTTATSRSRTSRSTSVASILNGSNSCAVSPTVSETRGLRRAEFAVAAFGATAFLLALLFVLDAVRFHPDLLLDGALGVVHGEPQVAYLLPLAVALFDVLALRRVGRSL